MTEEEMKDTIGSWVALVLEFPLAFFIGRVASDMWLWFVVPFGAPVIGVVHATGLLLLWMQLRKFPTEKFTGSQKLERLVSRLLTNMLTWGFAWVLHEMMA